MVSGAPKPGGKTVMPAGGYRHQAPGGMNMNDRLLELQHRTEPHAVIDVESSSGAQVEQERTVTVTNLGRASGATYLWTLPTRPGGSAATVTDSTSATASYTPDATGTFVFRCVVTFTGASKTQTLESTYVSD